MLKMINQINKYYNKILYVDLKKDVFKVIKLSKSEKKKLKKGEKFSEWTKRFAQSIECYDEDTKDFLNFIDISRLKNITKPTSINYRKMVDCVYHDVYMEIIPVDYMKIYILVKDWSEME